MDTKRIIRLIIPDSIRRPLTNRAYFLMNRIRSWIHNLMNRIRSWIHNLMNRIHSLINNMHLLTKAMSRLIKFKRNPTLYVLHLFSILHRHFILSDKHDLKRRYVLRLFYRGIHFILEWRYRILLKSLKKSKSIVSSMNEQLYQKILFMIGTLGPGGAERQFVLTLKGLIEKGVYDAEVVVSDLGGDTQRFFLPYLKTMGVSVNGLSHEMPMENGESPQMVAIKKIIPFELREVISYMSVFLSKRSATAHLWLDEVNIKAGVAAVITGIPNIILSTRSFPPNNFIFYQPYMRAGYSWLAKQQGVKIINNSNAGARAYEKWLKLPKGSIQVINNGFDFNTPQLESNDHNSSEYRKLHNIPIDALILGTVIRLTEEKRPFFWIDIAASVQQSIPDIHFLFVGDGPLRLELEQYALKQGVGNNFHFIGYEDKPFSAIAAMDLFLLTSRLEGLPNVLIEAQALGVPVVTTKAGGAPDTLLHKQTGWILDNDNVADAKKIIVSLLLDTAWLKRASIGAKNHVRTHFSLERMLNQTAALYVYKERYLENFKAALASEKKIQVIKDNILFMIGTLGPGGAERQLVLTMNGLKKAGLNQLELIAFFLRTDIDRFYLKQLEQKNVIVSELERNLNIIVNEELRHFINLAQLLPPILHDVADLIVAIFLRKPETLHLWLDEVNVKAGLAAVALGVPNIILSTRNMSPINFALYKTYMYECYRFLINQPGVRVINNSVIGARNYEKWLDLPEGFIKVVHNGFDFGALQLDQYYNARDSYRLTHNIPTDALVLGTVIRLNEEKRPFLWVDVAVYIKERYPQVHFLLVGDGPLRFEFEKYILDQGIIEHFHFTGHDQHPFVAMASMNLFLLTSRAEGLPNVLIEAQALGVPVVTTKAGGAPETLSHNRTGWVLENDNPEYIGETVIRLLHDKNWLKSASMEAQLFVRKHFNLDRMINETLNIYGHVDKPFILNKMSEEVI